MPFRVDGSKEISFLFEASEKPGDYEMYDRPYVTDGDEYRSSAAL